MAGRIDQSTPPGSKRPKRPFSYAEGVDEAPKLIEAEPVEVEESTPAERRSSVESVPRDDKEPPVFEE